MNKAVAAGIGVGIVLIAIAALYMMDLSDESNTQVDLSEECRNDCRRIRYRII